MSYNLTDGQKDIVRWLVQQVRTDNLPENFGILLSGDKPILSRFHGERDNIPDISDTVLMTLRDAGILTAIRSHPGVWNCTLVERAFEAVDSDFGMRKDPGLVPEDTVHVIVEGRSQGEGIPKVFISHSWQDAKLAESLVALLRSALALKAQEIRCTSVDGYRLRAGADVDERLRQEITEAPVFIVLISEASLGSKYVLSEFGARWGANKPLIPLLAPNVDSSILEGPIAGYNALSCGSDRQIHQLVDDVAKEFGVRDLSPAAYQREIHEILSIEVQAAGGETVDQPPAVDHWEFQEDFRGDLKRNWFYSGTWHAIDEGEGRVLRVTKSGIGGIVKPCLSWTDYVVEFDTKIENQNSSWIIRATRDRASYAVLQCRTDSIRPLFRFDGRFPTQSWSDSHIVSLPVVLGLDTWFHVYIEVRGQEVTVDLTLDDVGEIPVFSLPLLQSPPAPGDYLMGSVGFRESGDECACFRNVRVKRLP